VTRTVNNVGLIQVEGIEFEVDALLMKKRVQARYNPFDLSWIKVYHNDSFIGKVYPLKLSRWNTARRLSGQKPAAEKPLQSGLKPMAELASQHRQLKGEELAQMTGQTQKPGSKPLTIATLIQSIATALDKPPETFHPEEVQHLQELLETLPQLSAHVVGLAIARVILLHGQRKHISVYTQAIRQHYLNINAEVSNESK